MEQFAPMSWYNRDKPISRLKYILYISKKKEKVAKKKFFILHFRSSFFLWLYRLYPRYETSKDGRSEEKKYSSQKQKERRKKRVNTWGTYSFIMHDDTFFARMEWRRNETNHHHFQQQQNYNSDEHYDYFFLAIFLSGRKKGASRVYTCLYLYVYFFWLQPFTTAWLLVKKIVAAFVFNVYYGCIILVRVHTHVIKTRSSHDSHLSV